MQRKKDSLKITNLFNNANKIIHNNSNIIQNKFKNQFEQNYIYDNKINTNNTNSAEKGKSSSKSLGRKRKHCFTRF